MENLNDEAQRVMNILNERLHFVIEPENVRLSINDSISLTIDVEKQNFYHDLFINMSNRIRLLVALGDSSGGHFFYHTVLKDLLTIVNKEARPRCTINIEVPALEDCLHMNIAN